MIDPLAEVVTLLQPSARFSKIANGAGRWGVRRSEAIAHPFYCAVVEGRCRLTVDEQETLDLQSGDFVLIPAVHDFVMSSVEPATAEDFDRSPVVLPHGEFGLGNTEQTPDVRMLLGHCEFGSSDAALLISLLPRLIHVRGEPRLTTLVQLVGDECRERRPARQVILARLVEVLLIEAFRSSAGTAASPGLLRALADARLAAALRQIHEDPTQSWTIAQMAKAAALSRSAFFERFSRALGVAPMEYLLAWRMALAKRLLRNKAHSVAEVAKQVGYSSASAFSVAFTRFVGEPPTRYAHVTQQADDSAAA